ncbi:TolC family protein, partial [Pseudomonas viridiflava]|uniref:TolC family protein n=1 Tax=Pseudomonas viridiflava TaxID=33069 RepID=UPI0021D5BBF8
MPRAPRALPELPATVLASHPDVVSAEREAPAAWADIAVARADRLPRIDLAAALSGQWIRAAGSSLDFNN